MLRMEDMALVVVLEKCVVGIGRIGSGKCRD
jgi:hypothetical protein